MNKPVIVWQRGDVRIVAREYERELIVEVREKDAMDEPAWVMRDDDDHELQVLALEVASHNEVMPKWVRDLVAEGLARIEKITT